MISFNANSFSRIANTTKKLPHEVKMPKPILKTIGEFDDKVELPIKYTPEISEKKMPSVQEIDSVNETLNIIPVTPTPKKSTPPPPFIPFIPYKPTWGPQKPFKA
jgi:hypothetical protein